MWYYIFACKHLRDGRERASLFRYCKSEESYNQALIDLDNAGLLYSHTVKVKV